MTDNCITRRNFLAATALVSALGPAAGRALGQVGGETEGYPERPRLYFAGGDLPKLRQRFLSDPLLQKARGALLEEADAAMKRPLVTEDFALGGKGQHGNYYVADASASAAIETCGFAWLITQEQRYADHARKALRHFAQYKAWTGAEFARRDPPWHSALETAHFTRTFALGIDWLWDILDADERKSACEALARLGVEALVRDWVDPHSRIHSLDSMGHNWWMVCVAAGAMGAMSLLGQDKRAEQWLALSLESLDEFFRFPGNVALNKPATFDPAGGFYESLGYANYTLRYHAYLMAALRHIFPGGWNGRRFDRLPPQFDGMFDFLAHFIYPRRSEQAGQGGMDFLSPGFGDDGLHTAFSGDVTLFLANASGDGRYRWYFEQYTPQVDGYFEMLMYDRQALPKAQVPNLSLSRCLEGIGWASLRDSWKPNATFLAIKCGHTWNHAHADAGSFVVYAGGEPLLIDSGTCSYNRREYRSYYTESIAHNTVLVDGQGQMHLDGIRGTRLPGRLYPFLDAANARYILADATGPMAHLCRRFLRHLLWLDNAIVVVDDLLAHKPATFEWLFHGQTPPTFENGILRVQSGDAKLEMNVLSPSPLEAEARKGLAPKDPDRPLDYLALRQKDKTDSTKFFGVIRAGRDLPEMQITPKQGPEWIGARLASAGRQWDLYCNLRADGRRQHLNSNAVIEGWETDAFIVGVRSGEQRRVVLIDASYLRKADGTVILDCFSKCHAVLTYASDGAVEEIVVQGPAGSEVRLDSSAMPEHILMNGKNIAPAAVSRRNGMVVFRLEQARAR